YGKGSNPPVDPHGYGVTGAAAALSLVQFGGHARQRDSPPSRALGQCRGVDVEPSSVDHAPNLAARPEEFDRSELGQSKVPGVAESDWMSRWFLVWCGAITQTKARRHLPLGLKAGKA